MFSPDAALEHSPGEGTIRVGGAGGLQFLCRHKKTAEAEMMIALIHINRGEKEKAHQILDDLVELRKQTFASSWCMALLGAALDDFDRSFEFFDKAYEERETMMPFTPVYIDTANPAIKSDPRYKELLTRMNLPR